MRIGLLIYGSLNTISGGYLYDRMLVQHLRTIGHSVEIISLPWRNYIQHLGDNLSLALLHRLQSLAVDILLQDELNHPSLVLLNRLLAPGGSHAHQRRQEGTGFDTESAGRLPSTLPYPIISIVHHLRSDEAHPPLLRKLYRWIEAGYLRSVDGYICNSRTTRQRVRAVTNGTLQPALVAYPAADHLQPPNAREILAQLGPRIVQHEPLRILFVGNLIPRKGLHTLVDACTRLPDTGWELLVVGSLTTNSTYTEQVRAKITHCGMQAQVRLAGSLPTDQLREALLHHHLLVVPSFEGFGIVYLEAMAYGLPVIATTAGAARELVTNGETGYLIEPGNAVELAVRLQCLYRNRMHLAAMSVAARRRYDQHVTWQQSADTIAGWLVKQVRTS